MRRFDCVEGGGRASNPITPTTRACLQPRTQCLHVLTLTHTHSQPVMPPRHRRRTSGYRTRMATTAGRKLMKSRRLKGRWVLAPASQKSSGGKKK